MMPPDYLDVGPAIGPGYRVSRVRRRDIVAAHVLIESAADVAAAARLCSLPVLTTETAVIAACERAGVALLATPPPQNKSTFSKAKL